MADRGRFHTPRHQHLRATPEIMSLNLRIAMLLVVPLSVAVAEPHDLVLERCLVTLVEEAKVPAREAGVIVTLLVRLGQPVEKEEEIARIDDGVPHMELLKARQELEQAKAKKVAGDDAIAYAMDVLKVAEAELGMAEKANVPGRPPVHPKAVIDQLQLNVKKSEWQLKQSRLERDVAALAVTSEEVKVRAAESAIERRSIKSPITGVIHELPKHLGEWMQPGDTLAHVIRTDTLRVEGFVSDGVEAGGRSAPAEAGVRPADGCGPRATGS